MAVPIYDGVDWLKSLHSVDVEIGKMRFFGSYADVYEGIVKRHPDKHEEGTKVAVKRLRVHLHRDEKFAKALVGEIHAWERLLHENVVRFLGTVLADDVPSLVSEWMDNGTVVSYMKECPNADKLVLAIGIARGLEHIHDQGVIHSDLKGDNILVAADGTPKIADFGISRVVINSVTIAGTTSLKGNTRWMAVELLDPRATPNPSTHELHTKQTDVWAYGMVVYEILTGNIPYHHIPLDVGVILEIISGGLPERGPQVARSVNHRLEMLWGVCLECWRRNPNERPSSGEIIELLNAIPSASTAKSSFYVDVEVGTMLSHRGRLYTYQGVIHAPGGREMKKVMLKYLRGNTPQNIDASEWLNGMHGHERLKHENIVRLLGSTLVEKTPALVFEWMDNNTAVNYVKDYPRTDLIALAAGIAQGMACIHSQGLVHANLRGSSVLVHDNGTPKITDYGLAYPFGNDAERHHEFDPRWMAVELLNRRTSLNGGHEGSFTMQTDVWAYGMVIYEILSGNVPYHHVGSDEMIIAEIMGGIFPEPPTRWTHRKEWKELLWNLSVECWAANPSDRPSMKTIAGRLEFLSLLYRY